MREKTESTGPKRQCRQAGRVQTEHDTAIPQVEAGAGSGARKTRDLVWAEPASFRSADLWDARRWVGAMIVFTLGATSLVHVLLQGVEAPPAVEWKLWATGGGISAFFLVLLGATRFMRIVVRVTDQAIVRDFGERPQVYRFGDIDHCELAPALSGTGTVTVLTAELKNGDREIFCLDRTASAEDIRERLEQSGVEVRMTTRLLPEGAILRAG